MAVILRLQRVGAKKAPCYRIVAADRRKATGGRIIENLGHYDPRGKEPRLELSEDRVRHWLGTGALASETVRSLLARKGIKRVAQVPESRTP